MITALISGTWGWSNDIKKDEQQWYWPGSPYVKFLEAQGVTLFWIPTARGLEPYIWSTDVGGIGLGDRDLLDWAAAGRGLYPVFVPPRCPDKRIPGDQLALIMHSHGGQVGIEACASGLEVALFITVCSPIRKDMEDATKFARKNIKRWIHVHSDGSDKTQIEGEYGDSRFPLLHTLFGGVREQKYADVNIAIPGVGHSGLLRDPQHFHHWSDKNIINELRG